MSKEIISIEECATRLGMNQNMLRKQIVRGKTPFKAWAVKQDSGRWRYFIVRSSFEAWIKSSESDAS